MVQYRDPQTILKHSEEYETYYAGKTSWSVRERLAEKELEMRVSKDAHILDIGVGGGEFLAQLSKVGYRNLYGADLADYLSHIKREELKGFSETNINTGTLTFGDASLDVVTLLAFLEHVENAFHVARECARVIKPGGYLLVTLPHISNLNSRFRFLFGGHLDGYTYHNDHIMVLPKEVFKKCFDTHFTILKIVYAEGYIRIPFTKKKLRRLSPKWFGNKILYVLKRRGE